MIGQKLKQHREKKGISQEELARLADVSVRTVCSVERGKGCTFSTAKRLARAVGVKLEDLREVTP